MVRFGRLLALLLLTCACGGGSPSTRSGSAPTTDGPAAGAPALDGFASGLPESSSGEELEIPENAALVVFLGDSISAGLHLPANEAFPAQLQRMLESDGKPFRLVNAGLSGDTSAGGLRRLNWIMKQEPDLVVIELGANDGLRGQPVAAVEENLVQLVQGVRDAGSAALLLGMRIPTNFGEEYTTSFAKLYESVGERTGVPVQSFFMEGVAGIDEFNLPDGIHPTPEGHRILATNLKPWFQNWLEAWKAANTEQP